MNLNIAKKIIGLIILQLFLFNGCKHTIEPEVIEAVKSLNTPALQQAYLEKIYDDDQYVRTHSQAMEQQYGYQSDSVSIAGKEMRRVDFLNIDKIEAYLSVHGHPQQDVHGDKAFGTPITVIHHSPKGFKHRKEHFKTFYDAFEDNRGRMTMYLGRMYYIKFDKRMDIEGRYTEEFEIDTLIRSMDLDKLLDDYQSDGYL